MVMLPFSPLVSVGEKSVEPGSMARICTASHTIKLELLYLWFFQPANTLQFGVPYWVQGGQASLTDIHIHVSTKHPFRPFRLAYGVSLPAGMAQKTSLCQLNIHAVRSHPRYGKLCQLSSSDIYIYLYIGGFSISLAPILTWLLKSWFACLNPHALKTRGQWILGWSNDVFNGNHKF